MSDKDTSAGCAIKPRIIHGPDFQRLSPEARWVFIALKLYLGPKSFGIQVHNPLTLPIELAGCTGYTTDVVARALDELKTNVADKATTATWVEQEANVVWIVDHLRHDPFFYPANWPLCKAVVSHIAGLPNLGIVERFRAHYAAIIQRGEESRPGASVAESSATIEQPVVSGEVAAPEAPLSRIVLPPEVVKAASGMAEIFHDVADDTTEEIADAGQPDMFPQTKTTVPARLKKPKAPPKSNWAKPYFDVWEAAFDGDRFASGEGVRYLKPLHDKHGQEKVVKHLTNYCEHHKDPRQRQFARMPAFAQTFSIWERPRPVRVSSNSTKHAPGEKTGFIERSKIEIPDDE